MSVELMSLSMQIEEFYWWHKGDVGMEMEGLDRTSVNSQ